MLRLSAVQVDANHVGVWSALGHFVDPDARGVAEVENTVAVRSLSEVGMVQATQKCYIVNQVVEYV